MGTGPRLDDCLHNHEISREEWLPNVLTGALTLITFRPRLLDRHPVKLNQVYGVNRKNYDETIEPRVTSLNSQRNLLHRLRLTRQTDRGRRIIRQATQIKILTTANPGPVSPPS